MTEAPPTGGPAGVLLRGGAVVMAFGLFGCVLAAAGEGGGLGVAAAASVVLVGIGAALAVGGIVAAGSWRAPWIRAVVAVVAVVATLAAIGVTLGATGAIELAPTFIGAAVVGAVAVLWSPARAAGGRVVAVVAVAGLLGWGIALAAEGVLERRDDRREERLARDLRDDAEACIDDEWSPALSRSRAAARVERCLAASPGGEHWTCLPSVCSYTDPDVLEDTLFIPLPTT